MAFPMALTVAKGAIDVAINANKAAGFFKTLESSDEEAFFFWRMLDSLTRPLQTATALCRRHVALTQVMASVELCRYTIAKCQVVMMQDDGDDEDEPEDAGSWAKWLNHRRGGFSRLQQMKELLPKLQICLQTLNLSLTAAPFQIPARFLQPRAPFVFLTEAMEDAVLVIQQFEFGRVGTDGTKIATGNLFEREQLSAQPAGAPRRRVAIWKERGPRMCFLVKSEGSDAMGLKFEAMRDPNEEVLPGHESDTETKNSVGLRLEKETKVKRCWMDEVADLQCDREEANRVVYHLGEQLLFAFDAVNNVSAEVFEGILCMSKRIDGSPGAPACVAELLDIDATPLAWKEEMEKDLGPFALDAPSGEGDAHWPASPAGLGSALGKLKL